MKFKELTVEQFAEYAKNHPQYNFLQNPYMVSSQIARNTEVHCVGLVDDQDQVVLGLSYYVRRMKRIFKLAYADLVFFNNGMIVEDKEINISGLFPANIEQDMHYSEQKKIWKIETEAFKTIDAFTKILGSKS